MANRETKFTAAQVEEYLQRTEFTAISCFAGLAVQVVLTCEEIERLQAKYSTEQLSAMIVAEPPRPFNDDPTHNSDGRALLTTPSQRLAAQSTPYTDEERLAHMKDSEV